jgi:hypothetical protein
MPAPIYDRKRTEGNAEREEISVADIGPDIVFRLEAGSGCGDAEHFVEGSGL